MPLDALTQVENIGGIVQFFPALGQIGLHDKGAWPDLWTNLMTHELAVDEAQRGVRLEANCLMRIEMHRVIPTHTQSATALGLTRFGAPELGRTRGGQDRQRDASKKTDLQELTTT